MGWIDAINEFGESNAGAFNILSGAGGAASVIGFFAELEFRKNIENSLQEIKSYLGRVEKNTVKIIQQNEEILSELDQLPTRLEVRIMLRHAVNEGFIKNAYAELHAAENDIQGYWTSSSPNWISFRNSLQFAFDHDNQVSSTAELLAHCSFAVLITKGHARQFVFNVVTDRQNRLRTLHQALKLVISEKLILLRNDYLSNSVYISNHNFDDSLTDLSSLDFTIKPDRYDWIDGPCLVRVREDGFCAEPGEPRRILDLQFSRNRQNHKTAVEKLAVEIIDLNNHLGEIKELIERVERVLTTLSS